MPLINYQRHKEGLIKALSEYQEELNACPSTEDYDNMILAPELMDRMTLLDKTIAAQNKRLETIEKIHSGQTITKEEHKHLLMHQIFNNPEIKQYPNVIDSEPAADKLGGPRL